MFCSKMQGRIENPIELAFLELDIKDGDVNMEKCKNKLWLLDDTQYPMCKLDYFLSVVSFLKNSNDLNEVEIWFQGLMNHKLLKKYFFHPRNLIALFNSEVCVYVTHMLKNSLNALEVSAIIVALGEFGEDYYEYLDSFLVLLKLLSPTKSYETIKFPSCTRIYPMCCDVLGYEPSIPDNELFYMSVEEMCKRRSNTSRTIVSALIQKHLKDDIVSSQ